MVASIPRIESAVNFARREFWFVSVVRKYEYLNFVVCSKYLVAIFRPVGKVAKIDDSFPLSGGPSVRPSS